MVASTAGGVRARARYGRGGGLGGAEVFAAHPQPPLQMRQLLGRVIHGRQVEFSREQRVVDKRHADNGHSRLS